MKIAVTGPGGLARFIAARLAAAKFDVTYVETGNKDTGPLSVAVSDGNGVSTTSLRRAGAIPKDATHQIVACPAYLTASLPLSPVPTLSLQNGLGNIEVLCNKVGSGAVVAGCTRLVAHDGPDGAVEAQSAGPTQLGAWTTAPAEDFSAAFAKAGLEADLTDSPGQAVWEKTVIDSAVMPLSAILGVAIGRLLDIPEARQLMRDVVVEAVKVSATEGYRYPQSLVEAAEAYCAEAPDVITAMLHDLRLGRTTEIEALSGEVLRRAQVAALPCPRTRVLYQLIKSREAA